MASGLLLTLFLSAWADVEVGPGDGFAAVRVVSFATYEKTKDALVFSNIRYDMSIACHIPPLDTSRVTGFAFRYRVSGATSRPKAGGEVFYAPLGEGFDDRRKWCIPPLVRDGEWHEIRLSLSAVRDINDWRCCGLMTDFRFDPTNAEGGQLEIAWFRFLTSDSAEKAIASYSREAWEKRMREIFGPVAPSVLAIEQKVGKNRPENWQARLNIITDHWPEIRAIIREELPPREQVYALMRQCGMPLTPADLHLSRQDTLDALEGSREIRDKYLTSSLLWDLGLLHETAEKLMIELYGA